MLCEKCNKENRDIAKFCKWCGSPVFSVVETPVAVTPSRVVPLPMEGLVGLTKIKEEVATILATYQVLQKRGIRLSMNTLIVGETGTGKGCLAEALQDVFASGGMIKAKKLCRVDAVDFNGFLENWDENIKKSKGGILFIDNVQKLLPDGYQVDLYVLDKLFNDMDGWAGDPMVVLAGLPGGFENFLACNPDVANRFRYRFRLADYSADELTEICCRKLCSDYKLTLSADAQKRLRLLFKYKVKNKGENFGNGHTARNVAENILTAQLKRTLGSNATVLPEDITGQVDEELTAEQVMAKLNDFVGLGNVKEEIRSVISFIDMERKRSGAIPELKTHYVFSGNPGTGKTTVARVVADVFRALDVLPSGHLVEADRSSLVGEFSGSTAIKTNALIDKAMGGILFIDEAYNLSTDDRDGFGREAINTLLKRLEDDKGKFICIVAGYTKEMHHFIDSNPGLKSRFNRSIEFKDYVPAEMSEIFMNLLKKKKLSLEEGAGESVGHYFERLYASRDKNFGNAREVVKAMDLAINRQGERLRRLSENGAITDQQLRTLTIADILGEEECRTKTLDELLKELDEFVGMDAVKRAIADLARQVAFNRARIDRGIGEVTLTPLHIVLTGNPGTGKTSVARKLGQIFKAIGQLPTDKVIEVDRSGMVSSYMGETAKVVNQLCDRAMGGILFVDEAYTLSPKSLSGEKDKLGTEAIEALMKRLEDDKGKFVMIAAGYQSEMEHFMNTNPGLERRVTHKLHIDDYSPQELVEIYLQISRKSKYVLTEEAIGLLRQVVRLKVETKDKNFGNAGEMVKLFNRTVSNMATRLSSIPVEQLATDAFVTIREEDIPC